MSRAGFTMTELIRVVFRYLNGAIVKGYTRDFSPNKELFHVEVFGDKEGKIIDVKVKDLKALFFVKDFTGNSSYNERKQFREGQQITGRKVRVTFKDGEVLVGTTMGFDPKRQGFFFFPADQASNNTKIFAVLSAVGKVEFIQ
jgi:hypothetical protein